MEFTYEGLVRYGFGFQNPNHAAALFAALLPFCWGLRAWFVGKKLRVAVIPFELALYLCLVLTYSRAGVAALFVAVLFFYASLDYAEGKSIFSRLRAGIKSPVMWTSLCVFIGAALYAGAFKRYFAWMLSHDSSVTNRFSLWSGTLQLIRDNPHGVGTGESGRIFTLFYQPEGVTLAYRTLVNSFLTFAAEQGLVISGITAALVLTTIFLSLMTFQKQTQGGKIVMLSCLAALLSLLVSGMLSTCLDITELYALLHGVGDLNALMQSSLIILGLAALLALAISTVPHCDKRALLLAPSYSVLFVAVLCALGCFAGRQGSESCRILTDNGARWALLNHGTSNETMLVLPDEKVMGLKKTLALVKTAYPDSGFLMPLAKEFQTAPIGCKRAALFGAKIETYLEKTSGELTLFLPKNLPSFEKPPSSIKRIYLDSADEYGVNSQWIAAASGLCIKLR